MRTEDVNLFILGDNIKSGLEKILKYIHISNQLIKEYIENEEKEAGKRTNEFFEENGEISDFDIEDLCKEYFLVSSFPEVLYRSIFFETISFLEISLYELCKFVNDFEEKKKELNPENKYFQVKKMIKTFIKPDCLNELWDKFEIFREIRNHLYHNGSMKIDGNLKVQDRKRYETIISGIEDNNKKLKVKYLEKEEEEDEYKLIISKEFCLELLYIEKKLFENILRKLGTNYAQNSPLGNQFLQEAFCMELLNEEFKIYESIYN